MGITVFKTFIAWFLLTVWLATLVNGYFVWNASQWSSCRAIDTWKYAKPSQCCRLTCGRSRQVSCIRQFDHLAVPYYYCSHLNMPLTYTPCSTCQKAKLCIASMWSSWSNCTSTCDSLWRIRTRKLLTTARELQGVKCPSLIEREKCTSSVSTCQLQNSTLQPLEMWKSNVGRCEKFLLSNDTHISISQGYLTCIGYDGSIVSENRCKISNNIAQLRYKRYCDQPVDCRVSEWSFWSPTCDRNCSMVGVIDRKQRRYRRILQYPLHDGQSCPPLLQEKSCILPDCKATKFTYVFSAWGACKPVSNERNKTHSCYSGIQRRSALCMLQDTNAIVDSAFCAKYLTNMSGVAVVRECSANCRQDCLLGQWSSWSQCTTTCGAGVSTRFRQVIVYPKNNGRDCDSLMQSRECKNNNCSYWYTSPWSKCLSYRQDSQCGPGSSVRTFYCVSSEGKALTRADCQHSPKPIREKSCTIPCDDDCVISEWSEWTVCNSNCAIGVNKRVRYLLGTGNNCNQVSDLLHTRRCQDCPKAVCNRGYWDKCRPKVVGLCGINQGLQKRLFNCSSSDSNLPVDNVRDCNISCPVDCRLSREWSAWSICNQSCGASYATRIKYVLQYPSAGGQPCPDNVTADGLVRQIRSCSLPPCRSESTASYKWVVGEWSSCEVLQLNATITLCGSGVQIRSVKCRMDGRHDVDSEVCISKSLLNPPSSERTCLIPCPFDCSLTEWSEWSVCSHNCGRISDTRRRTRQFYNYNMEEGLTKCKEIVRSDLLQVSECMNDDCFTYKWRKGNWQSCVLLDAEVKRGKTCGNGVQKRSILCERSDNRMVNDTLCFKIVASVVRSNPCIIDCGTDCQVSEWSSWSTCDQDCGDGIRKRTRFVTQFANGNGRQCRHLMETDVCRVRSCDDIFWFTDTWSPCILNDRMKSCGSGRRNREVFCMDSSLTRVENRSCLGITTMPSTVETCQIACPGECAYDMWTEWSSCSKKCNVGKRTRTRTLLRAAPHVDCGEISQTETCNVHNCYKYYWTRSKWTRCLPSKSICGKGIQYRAVSCQRSDGIVVRTSFCNDSTPPAVQGCILPCNTDCILSQWSSWSPCSASCGLFATTTRFRSVEYNATGIGKPCNNFALQQTQPCNTKPCFYYNLVRGSWSRCSTVVEGCGHGRRYRSVNCVRNDGKYVDTSVCVHNLISKNENDIHFGLDSSTLDIATEADCYIPCSGDCLLTSWSEYSPCYYNCQKNGREGYRVRTRHILAEAKVGGEACPKDLVQITNCLPSEATCAKFEWRTGKWSLETGRRQVWCVDRNTGVNVTGCSELTMPSASIVCEPKCTGEFSECRDGKCICKVGFEGDGKTCMPTSGCILDVHCAYNNTHCNLRKQCACNSGFVPATDMVVNGPCELKSSNETISNQASRNARVMRDAIIGGTLAVCLLSGCILFIRWLRKRYSMNQPVKGRKTSLWNNDVHTVRRAQINEDDDVFFEE